MALGQATTTIQRASTVLAQLAWGYFAQSALGANARARIWLQTFQQTWNLYRGTVAADLERFPTGITTPGSLRVGGLYDGATRVALQLSVVNYVARRDVPQLAQVVGALERLPGSPTVIGAWFNAQMLPAVGGTGIQRELGILFDAFGSRDMAVADLQAGVDAQIAGGAIGPGPVAPKPPLSPPGATPPNGGSPPAFYVPPVQATTARRISPAFYVLGGLAIVAAGVIFYKVVV